MLKSGIRSSRKASRIGLVTTLVSLAALALIIFGNWLGSSGSSNIARISATDSASWVHSEHRQNDILKTGSYKLAGGLAELEFFNNTQVIIHAPCEFALVDYKTIKLIRGKIYARIAGDCVGFTVITPQATIVDYGTEFGVITDSENGTESHVFKGTVELAGNETNGRSVRLTTGQAASVDIFKQLGNEIQACQSGLFVDNIEEFAAAKEILHRNLVENGDFESDEPSDYIKGISWEKAYTDIAITSWNDDTPASVFRYTQEPDLFPIPDQDPTPSNRGHCFYAGIKSGSITQTIDVSRASHMIDRKAINCTLSGWLGGFGNHNDTIELIAIFLDGQGRELERISTGVLTPEARNNRTGFFFKSKDATLCPGTKKITVELKSIRRNAFGDCFADNIELILSAACTDRH